jgi:hypothetical protein
MISFGLTYCPGNKFQAAPMHRLIQKSYLMTSLWFK